MANPLIQLQDYGQSVWYDYISKGLITSGRLQQFVDRDGLRGITSNPAIFEKAIIGSEDYDEALAALRDRAELDAKAVYEHLAIQDIQAAADVMVPVYRQTDKRDGYVCLEVSPHLAHDTEATFAEATRLWAAVGRPNIMIKVPATSAGIPAIQRLIGEGISVNVTLLFSSAMYARVAEAHMAGLEALVARGGDPAPVASVASFFISRIDTAIDTLVQQRLQAATGEDQARLKALLGQAAIANAKLTYQIYQGNVAGDRWQALAARRAQTQRLLWASTGTKNPAYSDVLYVDELVGVDTVNTLPEATFEAYRDHGKPRASLAENPDEAARVMAALEDAGISMEQVTAQLLDQGVELFATAFDQLLSALQTKREAVLAAE